MKKAFILILFCLGFGFYGVKMGKVTLPGLKPAPRYNMVLISADTLRADRLGVNGNTEIRTPHLDWLASQGINFTRAYTNITTTNPSHATMLSSLFPFDHKLYSNQGKVSSKILTLPEILKVHGWYTAGIVNMRWLNPNVSNIFQGMDELVSCETTRKADETNKWVLPFIASQKNKKDPFFLFVHYVDAHTPYHAPDPYTDLYYPDDRNPYSSHHSSLNKAKSIFPLHYQDNPYVDNWLGDVTDVKYIVAQNKGSVTWLDHHVGQIIQELKRTNQWDNTILVFTSDHGESLGEHGLWFVHGGLFDATARVPLIMRFPHGPQGEVRDTIVQHVDLLPTLCSVLGVGTPHQVRGRNVFEESASDPILERAAFIEHAGGYLNAVVTSRYKYIQHKKTRYVYPAYPIEEGEEELYDLWKDPKEEVNLAENRPIVRRVMNQLLVDFRAAEMVQLKKEPAHIDENTLEMLMSLGYL